MPARCKKVERSEEIGVTSLRDYSSEPKTDRWFSMRACTARRWIFMSRSSSCGFGVRMIVGAKTTARLRGVIWRVLLASRGSVYGVRRTYKIFFLVLDHARKMEHEELKAVMVGTRELGNRANQGFHLLFWILDF